ncbi:MAG: amidase family protein 13 [Rhizobacter sp.]|nr:amidase family protein 13 [Rhizobacter sp.]
MKQLYDYSAIELLAAYQSGEVSPVEATRSVIDHIAAWEPSLCATYMYDPEAAIVAARGSEARWLKGEATGALDGVPMTIKENIATKGVPMPVGTAAADLVPMAADAPPSARVREAGAVILGKTTMPDYGMLSSGLSSIHELARNPWDLTKNPGGSSAGAGSAAAAGYGPLHLGTDIGGSVRLPAGWCGIYALKPSLGRIPVDPPYYGRTAGPMTRTVADSALLMSVVSAPDERDTMSLPWQDIDWQNLQRDLRGLKIGLMLDAGCGSPVEPEVKAAVDAAARVFEAAGAVVQPMKPFMTQDVLDGMDRFWRARSWMDLSALPAERRDKVLPFIVEWAYAAAGTTASQLFDGFNQMMVMRRLAVAACRPFDYVLSPTSPMPSFDAEWPMPSNDVKRAMWHIGFTVPFNMSEQPAASINCGYTSSGLPIGLQIAGKRFDDLGVLQVSHAYESLRGEQRPWPTPPEA